MPRQFSLQNLFQMLTALAAVCAWLRIRWGYPADIYPGHCAMIGILICGWGCVTRYPPWLAVKIVLIGFELTLAGFVDEFREAGYMSCHGYHAPKVNEYIYFCQLLVPKSALVGIGILPRLLVLMSRISRTDWIMFWLTIASTFAALLGLVVFISLIPILYPVEQ